MTQVSPDMVEVKTGSEEIHLRKHASGVAEVSATGCSHTPGPWVWWTSCSWRRLKRDDRGITQNVLEPYVCSDGHPDLSISREDMALIAAAPDLLAALEFVLTDPCFRLLGSVTHDEVRSAIAKAKGAT